MYPEPTTVRSLLGRAQVEMAIACLGSLARFSADAVRLVLHDDGTLGSDDLIRLRQGLGAVAPLEVVPRSEADERLAPVLSRFSEIRAYREANPLGLKLVDVALLEQSETVSFCDSDVLWLRPFSGVFGELPADRQALFMADSDNAYSVRSWDFLSTPGLRLRARVNSGVVRIRKASFDLERVEWFLARCRLRCRTPVWSEQTCWAVLAADLATGLLDPSLVRFPPEDPADASGAVALHFINPLRDRLPLYLDRPPEGQGGPPVVVATVAAPRCGPLSLLRTEVRRRLRRLAGATGRGGRRPRQR